MKKVLVAGATGYLGSYVVKEFKKQGFWVRALTRSAGKLDRVRDCVDEEFIGQATDASSLEGICKDIDVVFSSIGITRQKDKLTYMDVDYQANKNLLDQAWRDEVSKFIYVSVFYTENMKQLKAIQAKLAFEKELKKSGIEHAIIYPNGFFSDMLEYYEMAKRGKVYVFGSGEYKINPIHGHDLAKVCVKAALNKEREICVGGPDILTHNEIAALAFKTLHKKPKVSKIPLWIGNVLLSLARTFTSVKTYGPLEFFMTVLAENMVAPVYGTHHLADFYGDQSMG